MSFVEFESGPVRPLALTPDGSRLLAVNTPDNRLELFSVDAGGLTHTGSVPVGMEPVAVAARTNTEVWVVNHLSDSVSIVDLSTNPLDTDHDGIGDACESGTTTTTISTATTTTTTTLTSTTTTTTTLLGTTTTTSTLIPTTTTTTLPEPAVLIPTRAFRMRDRTVPVANPAKRRISFRSSSKLELPANRISPPSFGGAGDPTTAGATLRVYNSAGSGEIVTVTLPSTGWKALSNGYRFRQSGGAISRVVVKPDKIIVRGGGASWGYTLNEPTQGRVTVRLKLGSVTGWCAETGTPPRPPRIDEVDRFMAQSRIPPPPECPPVP